MRTSRLEAIAVALALAAFAAAAANAQTFGFGKPASEAEVSAWNLDIDRDGKALPAGGGSVEQGQKLFEQKCAACHGAKGEGGVGDRLVGGKGTLASPKPVKTVGSFWPYAPTLFDYIRRAMPMDAPQSLSNDEVYALTAYLLNINGVVPSDATMDARALAAVRMPNRDGFVTDPRPDVRDKGCMSGC